MTAPNNSDQAAMLPCPFCGSVADHKEWSDAGYHCISCADCDVAMDYFHTKREAIAAWNRRAPSQPPALHDELRLRIQKAIADGCNMRWQDAEKAARAAIAALSMPASEAVDYQAEIDACTHDAEMLGSGVMVDGRRIAPERVRIYTTPQPAPSAHAGGEAVACVRREALNFVSDSFLFPPHMADAGDVLLYTHPSPMPVDALLALLPGKKPYNTGGRTNAETGEWNMCRAEMERRITALLSGGAAREGKS